MRCAWWVVAAAMVAGPAPVLGEPATGDSVIIDYTVQEGDTCAAIAGRYYGDNRRYDLIHAVNPGMGPQPHQLQPGAVLRLRLPAPTQPDAEVTAVVRKVRARAPAAADWSAAERGLDLYRAWRVITQERSAAELTFRDATVIQMREQTLVIVYGATRTAARQTSGRAALDKGTLRSHLGELSGGRRLVVDTPSSEAGLNGGTAVVRVDGDGASSVSNHAGGDASVKGKASGKVAVSPGRGTRVRRGSPPAPARPLPGSPIWAGSPGDRAVALVGVGATVRGRWQPVAGAASYHVDIARQRDGRDVVAAVDVPAAATSFELHRLPVGVYNALVSAVDADGLESRPSVPWTFTVLELTGRQPGGGAPVDRGDPDAAPRLVVLPETRLQVPAGVRCAVGAADAGPAGGSAASPAPGAVLLSRPGKAIVTCVTEQGLSAGDIAVEVAAVTVRVAGEPAGARLRPGQPTTVRLAIESPLPLPGELLRVDAAGAATGVPVAHPDGTVSLAVTAAPGARSPLALRVGVADGAATTWLASIDLPVAVDGGARPPPGTTAPGTTAPVIHETLGQAISPRHLGLRDLQRPASLWLSLAGAGPGRAFGATTQRASAGVHGDLFGRRLRVEAAAGLDLLRRGGDSPIAASGAAGYRPWQGPRLEVVAELGLWLPLRRAGTTTDATVMPAVELATHRAAWTARTRHGLIVDPGDATLWTSAWGVDRQLGAGLSAGVEIDLAAGCESGERGLARGVAAALVARQGRLSLSLAARLSARSAASERILGASSLVVGAGVEL